MQRCISQVISKEMIGFFCPHLSAEGVALPSHGVLQIIPRNCRKGCKTDKVYVTQNPRTHETRGDVMRCAQLTLFQDAGEPQAHTDRTAASRFQHFTLQTEKHI